jgi:hypothetical protein
MAQQTLENGETRLSIRTKINENFTELYTDKVETDDPRLTDARTPLAHNHDSAYSALTHDHDLDYAALNHNHTGVYSPVGHNHDGTYSAASHNHDGTYAAAGHNHDLSYSAIGHNHDGTYATAAHNHTGTYEPANANIQTHIASAHAPSDAQKNSDITKAEIEAKLTGVISSHSHSGGGADPFTAKLILASDVVTGANTTPVNLTGMSFSYEANATYVINIYASVTAAAATTGAGFGVNCSTAPSIVSLNGLTTTGATGAAAGWHTITNNAITATSAAIAAASPTNTPMSGMGFVKMGGTAGTAQFIFRSETTAAATCRAGSVITVMKVS